MSMRAPVRRTTLSIDVATLDRLTDLAHSNERSVSAEARLAIRNHLEKCASPASRAQGSRDDTNAKTTADG